MHAQQILKMRFGIIAVQHISAESERHNEVPLFHSIIPMTPKKTEALVLTSYNSKGTIQALLDRKYLKQIQKMGNKRSSIFHHLEIPIQYFLIIKHAF